MGELGIAARVEFLGSRPQSELWRLYKGAEVTLMPGMGLVLLESVAVGTPVVGTTGTNVAVVPELAEAHSERFAIFDDNAPALARAIETVLDARPLRAQMGEEGRCAVQRFGWPSVGERYLDVFEACLAAQVSAFCETRDATPLASLFNALLASRNRPAVLQFERLSLRRPRRLARPRTPAFHVGNTGSNPVGDA